MFNIRGKGTHENLYPTNISCHMVSYCEQVRECDIARERYRNIIASKVCNICLQLFSMFHQTDGHVYQASYLYLVRYSGLKSLKRVYFVRNQRKINTVLGLVYMFVPNLVLAIGSDTRSGELIVQPKLDLPH